MELTPQCGEVIAVITARYAGAFVVFWVYYSKKSISTLKYVNSSVVEKMIGMQEKLSMTLIWITFLAAAVLKYFTKLAAKHGRSSLA